MSQPTASPLPVGFQLQEYRIERVLGHGGFGVTYLARDRYLHAQFAIKEYLPRDFAARSDKGEVKPLTGKHAQDYAWGLDRFMSEARALARFKHPNIVRVARMLEANGTAYMVMEFEVGLTLSEHLKRHATRLAEDELLGVFLPLLDGLDALHALNLIHRDIKPGNIYLRKNGPLLLDFGSARQVRAEGDESTLTTLVTPGYAPPEQYTNDQRQGPWSDVYAVGASMHMCMFGVAPVAATARSAALGEGEADPYEPAAVRGAGRYSPELLAAVDHALALRMRDRPQSALELKRELAQSPIDPVTIAPTVTPPEDEATVKVDADGGASFKTAVLSPTQGGRPRPSRWRWAAFGGAALLLVVLIGGAWRRANDDALFAEAQRVATIAGYLDYENRCGRCAHATESAAARAALAEAELAAATEARLADEAKAAAEREAAASGSRKPDARGGTATRTAAGGTASGTTAGASGTTAGATPTRRGPAAGTRLRDQAGGAPGPELVVIAAGRFQMGDSVGSGGRDELPVHRVEVAAFALGLREVTRAEFAAFVEATGHKTDAQRAGGCRVTKDGRTALDRWANWKRGPFSQEDASPAICVSWNDAQAYADWLATTTKRRYRLPTEAEWEYAARAGTATDHPWGAALGSGHANCQGCGDGARDRTLPTGSFAANPWGLFDVAGNVAEWTCSVMAPRYGGDETVCAGRGALRDRVVRGGSWADGAERIRSAARGSAPLDYASDTIGFRVAADL